MRNLTIDTPKMPFFRVAVSRNEAAKMLDVSPSTFDEWVKREWMPQGIKLEGLRRWDVSEIYTAWRHLIEENLLSEEDYGENPFDYIIG